MKIVGAAVKVNGLVIFAEKPKRHSDVLSGLIKLCNCDCAVIDMAMDKTRQGFVTSSGTFVTREEAMKIAIENGQLDSSCEDIILTSDHLW